MVTKDVWGKETSMPRLQDRYRQEIVPAMMQDFGYRNVMQVPKLQKIVVNIGLGEAINNARAIDAAAAI
jgi:large subunit ribosomal protein L5